ncbi:WD repeat domain 35 [Perkinsus olseni]|uniref:WD repeat domain 35 n=1 Tax=Perkinsus olseni TaxID=32597 RepID=A0A7J6L0F8_PEROL|nr:WD repeat domain 35 [Perkinsus olseni]
MFSYLSKKIAVPQNLAVEVVSWNVGQGWLAIGGANGFLKVLKLDGSAANGPLSSSNSNDISMNQTLEGHQMGRSYDAILWFPVIHLQHSIRVIVWNENFRKLTTSDAKGLIIVWSLNQGAWFEEMVNNRNRSVVTDMRWSKDGQRICIVYEDGAVIVGTVDGQRLWGKEMNSKLSKVEWLPDSRGLIFCTSKGEVQIYDSEGIFSHRIPTACLDPGDSTRFQSPEHMPPPNVEVSSIEWWGSSDSSGLLHAVEKHSALPAVKLAAKLSDAPHLVYSTPNLCIAFVNGKAQLMRGIQDSHPIILDTGLNIVDAKWSPSGQTIAIAGISAYGGLGGASTAHQGLSSGSTADSGVVKIYSAFGQHLCNQQIPTLTGRAHGLKSISWEGSGARMALAVDSYIYFSTIRCVSLDDIEVDRLWGYFASRTLLFVQKGVCGNSASSHSAGTQSRERVQGIGKDPATVTFWDTEKDLKHVKSIRDVVAIATCDTSEVCAIFTGELPSEAYSTASNLTGMANLQFVVRLYNDIGAPVDEEGRSCPIAPRSVAMTPEHLLVASDDEIYLWNYGKSSSAVQGSGTSIDRGYLGFGGTIRVRSESMRHVDDRSAGVAAEVDSYVPPGGVIGTKDPIVDAAIARGKALFICRASGIVQQYSSLRLSYQGSFDAECRPQRISINCDATRLSIIDVEGWLHVFELPNHTEGSSTVILVNAVSRGDRRDIWQSEWAADQPDLLAIMEKSRMYILRSMKPEEPVTSEAYIYGFSDLQIKGVMLDGSYLIESETKTLRDTREILAKLSNLKDAFNYVEANPHKRLWRLLAESALEQLDVGVAEKAFVRFSSYSGIQLCHRLRDLDDDVKRRAEICAVYSQRFEEAEALYKDIDRKDLAIALRLKLGDWLRVVRLLEPEHVPQVDPSGVCNLVEDLGSVLKSVSKQDLLKQAYVECGRLLSRLVSLTAAVVIREARKVSQKFRVIAHLESEYAALEDFESLYQTAFRQLPTTAALLQSDVARILSGVGQVDQAANLLFRTGEVHAAIKECVSSNHWSKAIELAEKYKTPMVETILEKYAAHLIQTNRIFSAVELWQKAGRHVDAAKLLVRMADRTELEHRGADTIAFHNRLFPSRKKKLYLLSALEMESHKKKTLGRSATRALRFALKVRHRFSFKPR